MTSPKCAAKVNAMVQVFKFDEAVGANVAQQRRAGFQVMRREQPVEEPDDFWPEVSSGLWVNQPVPVSPANAPGRVLSEILLILGGAGFVVLLTTIFFGTPSP
jgi:hypothetical protein